MYLTHFGHTTPFGQASHYLHGWEHLAHAASFDRRQLARLCMVSTRTLDRRFQEQNGQTVQGWLDDYRLRIAWERLPSAENVKEVAIDLGFKQASHFSRKFRERFGISPQEHCASKQQQQPDAGRPQPPPHRRPSTTRVTTPQQPSYC